MSATGSNILARCMTAIRSTGVATAAGLSNAVWSDTVVPHVFRGDGGGFIGGRNRGRLPFVDFHLMDQPFRLVSPEGGTVTTTVVLTVYFGGIDSGIAQDFCEGVLCACLSAIRSELTDNFMAPGDEVIKQLAQGPFGHQRDAEITVEHTYDRATYDLQ